MSDPQQGYNCAQCRLCVDDEYMFNDEILCSTCYHQIPRCKVCDELIDDGEMCEECELELLEDDE